MTAHGNWKRLSRAAAYGSMHHCADRACLALATYVCNAHSYDGDWCGTAYCGDHLRTRVAPAQQPGACSPACVHLMEAATLSARLVEAEEARDRAEARVAELEEAQKVRQSLGRGAIAAFTEEADERRRAEAARDRALGLLNRWLSQHSAGGATDPCCVAAELVKESWAAVYPGPKEPSP